MKENEIIFDKTDWKTVIVGIDARVQTRPVDPYIMAQMPNTSETFVRRSFFKIARYELRKILYDIELTLKGGATKTPPPQI